MDDEIIFVLLSKFILKNQKKTHLGRIKDSVLVSLKILSQLWHAIFCSIQSTTEKKLDDRQDTYKVNFEMKLFLNQPADKDPLSM